MTGEGVGGWACSRTSELGLEGAFVDFGEVAGEVESVLSSTEVAVDAGLKDDVAEEGALGGGGFAGKIGSETLISTELERLRAPSP